MVIFSLPKNGDSSHNVPCQYSDFISESIPGLKYMCFINEELLRTCQIISLIDNWYDIFESFEVDGVFFDEIETDFSNIGRIGRCYLHLQNLRIFFTTWVDTNWELWIISARSS